jgi:phosphatidylinositol glycan class M
MLGVGAWMDRASSGVKYTDIDYLVFSDAAHFLNQGGSPYERDTYRYTPFLAYLLLPNLWLHPAWGKVLFIASDLVVGLQVMRISAWTTNASSSLNTARGKRKASPPSFSSSSPLLHASLWLFNPLVINFSTRGSADTLVSALVLATVLFVQQKRPVLAGLFHGAAVHFKLYPIVFSFSYLAAVPSALPAEEEKEEDEERKLKGWSWRRLAALITKDRLLFTAVSATTFLFLTFLAFLLFGHAFLQHGLLYHLTRTDNRHNFSPWFYAIYLDFRNEARRHYLGLAAFLPQVLLLPP